MSLFGRRRPAEDPPPIGTGHAWDPAELEVLRDVLRRASMGDLDVRVSGVAPDSQLAGMGHDINHLLDLVDAFLRETEGCLTAAESGRHYRRFVLRGMLGAFAAGARQINSVGSALAAYRAVEVPAAPAPGPDAS